MLCIRMFLTELCTKDNQIDHNQILVRILNGNCSWNYAILIKMHSVHLDFTIGWDIVRRHKLRLKAWPFGSQSVSSLGSATLSVMMSSMLQVPLTETMTDLQQPIWGVEATVQSHRLKYPSSGCSVKRKWKQANEIWNRALNPYHKKVAQLLRVTYWLAFLDPANMYLCRYTYYCPCFVLTCKCKK